MSSSPLKRLTRREKSRRGQKSVSENHQKDKLHVSFSEEADPSISQSSKRHSKLNFMLRRHSLLLEDGPDRTPHNYRASMCSWPDLSTDAPVTGSRSMLLRQTEKKLTPSSPSSSRGQSYDICVYSLQ